METKALCDFVDEIFFCIIGHLLSPQTLL